MLLTRISRWLRLDLPHQIRGLGLPVADVFGADLSFTPLRLTCELLGTWESAGYRSSTPRGVAILGRPGPPQLTADRACSC
jgi:hypothetical protein